MIDRKWLDENKRLRWEFFFDDEDGGATPELRAILEKQPELEIGDLVLAVLPYYVKVNDRDETWKEPPNEWMRENIHGAWSMWTFQCRDDSRQKFGSYYAFERAVDAVFFKLAWI